MGIRAEISEGMNYGNDREELAGQEGNRSRNVVAKERKGMHTSWKCTHSHWQTPIMLLWSVSHGGEIFWWLIGGRICYVAGSHPLSVFFILIRVNLTCIFNNKIDPSPPPLTLASLDRIKLIYWKEKK